MAWFVSTVDTYYSALMEYKYILPSCIIIIDFQQFVKQHNILLHAKHIHFFFKLNKYTQYN